MELAVPVIELGDKLKEQGSFVFAEQLHRAAVPSNIAEGHGRRSRQDYARFVLIAHGSLREIQTQLELISKSRKLLAETAEMLLPAAEEIGRMLNALHRSLRKPPKNKGDGQDSSP